MYTNKKVIDKFIEYLKSGKPLSPMNTEPCRRYLEAELEEKNRIRRCFMVILSY